MSEEIIDLEGIIFVVFHHDGEPTNVLNEIKLKGRPLIGTYSFDIHQKHIPDGEYHLHLYDKRREILAINKDSGTAHDGYHGVRIPNKAFNALRVKFKDWKWPDNQLLEGLDSIYFTSVHHRDNLRRVKVLPDPLIHHPEPYDGYFHEYAVIDGGRNGAPIKTVAIIEKEDGSIETVREDLFKFIDGTT